METKETQSFTISHKYASLYSLKALIEELNKLDEIKCQALIFTALGVFKGDICDIAKDKSSFIVPLTEEYSMLDFSYVKEMADIQCQKIIEENPNSNILFENPNFISLKNVTFISNSDINTSINQDQVCIFIDQIIGFSYKKI